MYPIRSKLRAALRFLAIICWILLTLLPAMLLHYGRQRRMLGRFVQFYYRACCLLFGLRLEVRGAIDTARPLLLTSNHTSYLDIPVLGSLAPLSFTPKREIKSWPVIGYLAVLADCVFIERRPAYMQQAAAEMREKLARGNILAIFGEGTTTDGIHLKPFKSGFFSLAIDQHLVVQPVSIAYTHFGRRRIADDRREEVAWVGDATLIRHIWHILSMPCVRVTVQIHPAIPADRYTDRKQLASECERLVQQGVTALMDI